MILYNTTFCLDVAAVDDWRRWMDDFFIPLVRKSGYFVTYKTMKLIQDSEDGSVNYCCQLFAKTMNDYQLFVIEYEPKVNESIQTTFGGQCLPFATMLQIEEEGEI